MAEENKKKSYPFSIGYENIDPNYFLDNFSKYEEKHKDNPERLESLKKKKEYYQKRKDEGKKVINSYKVIAVGTRFKYNKDLRELLKTEYNRKYNDNIKGFIIEGDTKLDIEQIRTKVSDKYKVLKEQNLKNKQDKKVPDELNNKINKALESPKAENPSQSATPGM